MNSRSFRRWREDSSLKGSVFHGARLMAHGNLIIETFPVGPLACNCTILGDPATKEAIVVDPGDEPEKIQGRLRTLGLQPVALVHTHAHVDHIFGTREVAQETRAKILLHEKDQWLYDNLRMQAQWIGLPGVDPIKPSAYLAEGDEVRFGGFGLRAIHTPGHTPGSLCFHLPEQNLLFSGDTLFAGSIGRTDLWGGSMEEIVRSIRGKLFKPFEAETQVVPGHGPGTTIGEERQHETERQKLQGLGQQVRHPSRDVRGGQDAPGRAAA